VKTLKDLRAELNKELAEFEGQRKTIKSAILKPYEELENICKIEISEKYNEIAQRRLAQEYLFT
jgi:hypothetical protein